MRLLKIIIGESLKDKVIFIIGETLKEKVIFIKDKVIFVIGETFKDILLTFKIENEGLCTACAQFLVLTF